MSNIHFANLNWHGGRMSNRLAKQMEFILELDKLKKIQRQTYLADASRKENDAEHSWHLAIMAMLLGEHANETCDVLKVIKMVLIHDVIEIDAGDTYAYDMKEIKTKKDREEKAADRLFHLLPSDQAGEMRKLWDEFEAMETMEAKFANTLDKVQPIMLNDASGGLSWKEHNIKKEQVLKRNEHTALGSKDLWEFCSCIIEKNVKLENLKD